MNTGIAILIGATFLAGGIVVSGRHAVAADVAVRCEPPKGWDASYGNVFDLRGKPFQSKSQGIRWVEDGFSNVSPILIWREESPTKLLISWGHAVPDELVGRVKSEPRFDEASVVYRDGEQIQAIERRCGPRGCTVYLTSLFPKLGFLTMLRTGTSGVLHPDDQVGRSALYAASCKPLN